METANIINLIVFVMTNEKEEEKKEEDMFHQGASQTVSIPRWSLSFLNVEMWL